MSWIKDIVPQEIKNVYHYFQAFLAALVNGFPSRKLNIIGVTGTDGKTTTVTLTYHILKTAGIKVSMISSVKAVIGEAVFDTGFHVTTPSPFEIQKMLKMMVKAGSKMAVLEVTSHGLNQNRVAFIDFHTAVITNVTDEHLDYHKNYESYLKTKAKILAGVKHRIINKDDASYKKLSGSGSGKMVSFGLKNADVEAENIKEDNNGLNFDISFKEKGDKRSKVRVFAPLIGKYNVFNILAAASVAKLFGVSNDALKNALASFPTIEGRMEKIDEGQDFGVYVDFAHTPNALRNSLTALKAKTYGKLICVFGAAGERDRSKRPAMGEAAARFCDFTVLTGEDPRGEDVNKIIEEIALGLQKNGGKINQNYWQIPDRTAAIKEAIVRLAASGDTVVVLGKGHEKSMNIGGVEYPWSDHMAIRDSLSERLGK